MRADLLIILLFLMVASIAWAATVPEATDEQPKASENICPEGFLEGYPCRKHRRVKRIVESHEDAIAFIGDILARRAPEGLQDLPMPTEFAGLFSYLRWHRALYGLDDIDLKNLPRHDLKPIGEETEQGAKIDSDGAEGTTSRTSSSNAGKGVEDGEKHRTIRKNDKGLDDKGIQPPDSINKERAPGTKPKRTPIPGLPLHTSPSLEQNMPPEGMATGPESDKASSTKSPLKNSPSEKYPGEEKSGQDEDMEPIETEAALRKPLPNAGKDMEGDGKHRTVQKQNKAPDNGNMQPSGSDKKTPEPAKIDNADAQNGMLQASQVGYGSPEYHNVLKGLRKGGRTDQAASLADVQGPNGESTQQEMEIYRIDSCVIGQDRGESDLSADNVTGCGPSGRLLAGFKPGKYRIIKDNFPPSYQPLLAGLEHSLLGYELPEGETVLILGYADHIPYKDDYDPPRIDKYNVCSFHAGKLQFNEVEAAGDSRSADDDDNQQLALARAREIQRWLEKKGVLKSDRVCLMASSTRPKIDGVPAGEPLDRAVAVYILRPKARTTEANHVQP
uniref:OmpA family protein n=1 Tax=Candidatus Kentrum sp. UNK TaxID=2126344 RepID=A0A451AEX6_9GAMM|nr:MAG: hypothetical protein BECKUNK1418G_GA0071005_10483 [Candidatus Kentron sp. UNK]VFK71141.1 MAG: hypothetical protein BECKUNK1418H_GA0071006_10523 [Candidatus Kentron sp. UNK]